MSEIFRDSDVLRQNREKARLKFLFLDHGWTPERFLDALQARLGFSLDPAVPETLPEESYRDHVGVQPQKQAGLVYAGLPILRGRLAPDQMRDVAGLAERYGTGELRTTTMQNLVIVNAPRARAGELERAIDRAGFPLDASPFRRGTVACTGSEFCKLALTETKGFARWLVEDLEARLPGFDEHVRINVTGCPNSCGQHWIADIGIEGKKIKMDGRLVDAYYFCVGGAVGRHQAVARPVGYRVPAQRGPRGGRAAAARVPRRAAPGPELPRVLRRAHRRRAPDVPGRRARRGRGPRRLARPRSPWTRRLRSTTEPTRRHDHDAATGRYRSRPLPSRPSADMSAYYPVFLDLADRPVLVIGGGPVAEGKVEGLLAAGARPSRS